MDSKPRYDPRGTGKYVAQIKIRHLVAAKNVYYDLFFKLSEPFDTLGPLAALRVVPDARAGVNNTIAFAQYVDNAAHEQAIRFFDSIEYWSRPIVVEAAGRTDVRYNSVDPYMIRAIRNRYPDEVAKYYPDSAGLSQSRALVEPTTSDRADNRRSEPDAIQSAERRDVAVGTEAEVDYFYVCVKCHEECWLPEYSTHKANCTGPTKYAEIAKKVSDHIRQVAEKEDKASASGQDFEPDLLLNLCTERCAICLDDFFGRGISEVTVLNCGHQFCSACITHHARTSGYRTEALQVKIGIDGADRLYDLHYSRVPNNRNFLYRCPICRSVATTVPLQERT